MKALVKILFILAILAYPVKTSNSAVLITKYDFKEVRTIRDLEESINNSKLQIKSILRDMRGKKEEDLS